VKYAALIYPSAGQDPRRKARKLQFAVAGRLYYHFGSKAHQFHMAKEFQQPAFAGPEFLAMTLQLR